MTQWVSRAQPHHNLPTFLNLTGTFSSFRYQNITIIVDDDQKKQIDLDVKKGRFSLSRGKQLSLWDDGPLVAKNITIEVKNK